MGVKLVSIGFTPLFLLRRLVGLANLILFSYTVPTSGHRIAAIMAAFQAAEGVSTTPARSRNILTERWGFFFMDFFCTV